MAGDKKNAARLRATIVFVDETGFSERPSVRRTWAPRGQTPILRHCFRSWKNLSAIGGLAYRSRGGRAQVYLMLHRRAIRSGQVVQFLKHLRRHVPGRVFLLWDGLHAHRSLETKGYLEAQRSWLTVYRLPAYAPELNPVEPLWAWFKGTTVPNMCPDGLEPIGRELRLGSRRLRRHPELLRGFLHKAGLFF